MDPEKLKGLGNEALKNKQFEEAISFYTEAINVATAQKLPVHVYYSNRAAAQLNLQNFQAALDDSEECIKSKPDWPKGYGRKGNALHNLRRYAEAEAAYKDGLKYRMMQTNKSTKYLFYFFFFKICIIFYNADDAALKKGLADLEPFLSGPGSSQPMGSPFGNPAEIMQKLASHPETKEWLKDPSYMQMLMSLQQNPQNIMQHMSDPRMMKTFSVMTGLDLGAMAGGAPNAAGKSNKDDCCDDNGTCMDTSEKQQTKETTPTASKTENTHTVDDLMEDEISDDEMEDDEAKAEKERIAKNS